MTQTISRFQARLAPCGLRRDGDSFVTEDDQGLVTEELEFACGCRVSREEFHDGSVHRQVVDLDGIWPSLVVKLFDGFSSYPLLLAGQFDSILPKGLWITGGIESELRKQGAWDPAKLIWPN